LGARLAIGKPTPVTCLSGWGAQGSTGAQSSEWKQRLAKNTLIIIIIILYGSQQFDKSVHECCSAAPMQRCSLCKLLPAQIEADDTMSAGYPVAPIGHNGLVSNWATTNWVQQQYMHEFS
jgi:hypothetical protein